MCAMVKTRNGLTVTTASPAAADLYQEGLDLVLSQNYGPEEKIRAAIDADDGFAMANVVLAYVLHLQTNVPAARAAAERGVELSAGLSQEERQLAQIVHCFTHGKGTEAINLIHEHLAEFPTDTLAMRVAQRLYMLGCFGAGVPDFPNHLMSLMSKVAQPTETTGRSSVSMLSPTTRPISRKRPWIWRCARWTATRRTRWLPTR